MSEPGEHKDKYFEAKKTPKIAVSLTIPLLYSVRRAAGTAQEGSPLSWLNLPPQWVVPLKSLGSPTEGLNTNTSDWVPHLIPPLKQLAHQSLIEKIIWKALTKLKGLRYGEMDVQSRSSVLPDCHYLSCSYLSLQMEVSGLTGTWGTIALPSCLQDMLPLGFCFMQQQDQQGQVATLFLNHWHSFWIAKEVRMRADQAAWTQAGWHLGCEVSAMFSAFFVLSGQPDSSQVAELPALPTQCAVERAKLLKVTFLLQERFFWKVNPVVLCLVVPRKHSLSSMSWF